MRLDLQKIPSFGVAGNFTGHLEQAGEALSFKDIKTSNALEPKALFPTYIPPCNTKNEETNIPQFLNIFPFNPDFIEFPEGEEKLQIESECAVVFDAKWDGDYVVNLTPVAFTASNDCSIRREGECKISTKKNWGKACKGVSFDMIPLDSFCRGSVLDRYRIASFLVRDGNINAYGENSPVSGYSYMYEKLSAWIIEKLNTQKDRGPIEDIHSYLLQSNKPARMLFSIGATRYTEYGQTVFLQDGDVAIVVLYPEDKYSPSQIASMALRNELQREDISALVQKVILG